MTIAKVIDRINRLKPNSLTNDDITDFINEIEKEISINIFHLPKEPEEGVEIDPNAEPVPIFVPVTDPNQELLAPMPHENVYFDYVAAKIDYYNGDVDLYSLSSQQFNNSMSDLKAFCIRKGITPGFKLQRTDYY